jgi:hypothetical protein
VCRKSPSVEAIICHIVWLELILIDWWGREKEDLSIVRYYHRVCDNMFQAALVTVQWDMLAAAGQDGIIGTEEYNLEIDIKQGN